MVTDTQLNITNIMAEAESYYALTIFSANGISNTTEWLLLDDLIRLNIDYASALCRIFLQVYCASTHLLQFYTGIIFQKLTLLYHSMLVPTDFVYPYIEENHAHSFLFTVSAPDIWKLNLFIFLFEHSFIILMLSCVFILFKLREKPSSLNHALLQVQFLQDKIEHDRTRYEVRSELINDLSLKLAKEKMNTFVLKHGGNLNQVKGWKIVEVTRSDGSKDDKYYYNTHGQRFRSLNEIAKHLNLVSVKDCVITRPAD